MDPAIKDALKAIVEGPCARAWPDPAACPGLRLRPWFFLNAQPPALEFLWFRANCPRAHCAVLENVPASGAALSWFGQTNTRAACPTMGPMLIYRLPRAFIRRTDAASAGPRPSPFDSPWIAAGGGAHRGRARVDGATPSTSASAAS